MNRRSLLKSILGAGAAFFGSTKVASGFSGSPLYGTGPITQGGWKRFSIDPYDDVVHPEKQRTYKDLYWEAQQHINELEGQLGHTIVLGSGTTDVSFRQYGGPLDFKPIYKGR